MPGAAPAGGLYAGYKAGTTDDPEEIKRLQKPAEVLKDVAKGAGMGAAAGAASAGVAEATLGLGASTAVSNFTAGAAGGLASQGASDAMSGEFSGLGDYLVSAGVGAGVGLLAPVAVSGMGKLLGSLKAKLGVNTGGPQWFQELKAWWFRGSEADEAYRCLSLTSKFHYEIGQKTFANADDYARYAGIDDPIIRGQQIIKDMGLLRAMHPQDLTLGARAGTLPTGPTPGVRLAAEKTGVAGLAAAVTDAFNTLVDYLRAGD